MQKRGVGQSGIAVSRIGLGTVKFGRNEGVKYPDPFALPTMQTLDHLLGVAFDAGINLLDTAPAYGASEERLGELIAGKRNQWVISTKVGEVFNQGNSTFDFSPAGIENSIHQSLRKLKTDYLDIVLVHSNGDDTRLIVEEQVFATLMGLKAAGKCRAFGMSTKTVAGGIQTIDDANTAVVMMAYNPLYRDEYPVLMHAAKKQKGVFIKKVFASGHLAADYHKDDLASDPYAHAIQFALQESGVTSVIVGTINPAHLRVAIAAAIAAADMS